QALIQFQVRMGLEPDGILGRNTLSAINVSVENRIHQIQVNVERVRKLPSDLDGEHVFVNAADFKLSVIEHGKSVLDMKVVVGNPYRKTPVFSSQISSIILNLS